jgi:hypothetical protein
MLDEVASFAFTQQSAGKLSLALAQGYLQLNKLRRPRRRAPRGGEKQLLPLPPL